MNAAGLDIRPWRDADRDEVVRLILGIQRDEYGMEISAADQPDLADVASVYQSGAGNFWLCRRGGHLVGTIGLIDIGDRCGALRKMFVEKESRGRSPGVAAALLDELVAWARAHGIGSIVLGTTAWFHAAVAFYMRNGFSEIGRDELPPAFPVMAVDSRFFLRRLDG